MKYMITGCAGFIGSNVACRLLSEGHEVIGIDSMNRYYPPELKKHRVDGLREEFGDRFTFITANILDLQQLKFHLPSNRSIAAVLHFAAYAGVRYSIQEPILYTSTNIDGSVEVLEFAKRYEIKKVLLASSSSVYGNGSAIIDGETGEIKDIRKSHEGRGCYPMSPYAASKAAMELMGLTYHNLYGMDILIPRYFTVYGEAGRPDMAYFKFMLKLAKGERIDIYGDGKQLRDMTYISDAVDATVKMLDLKGYQVINVGGGSPAMLDKIVSQICTEMGIVPNMRYTKPMLGDPLATWADNAKAKMIMGWEPKVGIEEGLQRTVKWFMENSWLMEIFGKEAETNADQDS